MKKILSLAMLLSVIGLITACGSTTNTVKTSETESEKLEKTEIVLPIEGEEYALTENEILEIFTKDLDKVSAEVLGDFNIEEFKTSVSSLSSASQELQTQGTSRQNFVYWVGRGNFWYFYRHFQKRTNGWLYKWVADNRCSVPRGVPNYMNNVFYWACMQHDFAYANDKRFSMATWTNKYRADVKFLHNMYMTCNWAYSWRSSRNICYAHARTYYFGVRAGGAWSYYNFYNTASNIQ